MVRNEDIYRGVAIGIGIAVLTPLVIAALAPVIKPVARSALKAGIRVYEKGRESLEVMNETVDDIIAEVEEEMVDAHETEEGAEFVEEITPGATRG